MDIPARPRLTAKPQEDGVLVLKIDDPAGLNHETTETYPESLYESVSRAGRSRVALDLGAVDLLSSRGVRVLVNLKRRVETIRGRLVLFRLRPYVRHQLDVTNLADHFPIAEDRPAAVDLLRSNPPL